MKLRNTVLAAAMLAMVPLSAQSGETAGSPIVELMPHVKQLRPSLGLNAQQDRVIDSWIAEAPARRKAMEAEMLELRAQMREAILSNRSRMVRERLKARLADKQSRLIEMRALCARMLRNTLTAEQFARVVESYRATI